MVAVLSVLFVGCADKTGIVVEVTSSDLSVPGDVDALRFVVVSDTGRRVDQTFQLDGTWPHSLAVLPADPDDARVTITVIGLRGGADRVRRVVSSPFDRGTSRRVVVTLSRDCLDRGCPEGVDCVGGMCVGEMPDGGVDGGMPDGGMSDGGTLDGGPMDGGPRDGGPPDGGARDGGPDAFVPDGGPPTRRPLYFSEYVEGSSNNKALEIYNASDAPIDLTGCSVRNYANGASAPTGTAVLTATIPAQGTWVLCHGSAGAALQAVCNQPIAAVPNAIAFNGDDAVELFCDGNSIDVIGQIGVDPGTQWGSGATSTLDATLRRNCSVTTGRANGEDPFNPADEWTGFPIDTFGGLGSRGCP